MCTAAPRHLPGVAILEYPHLLMLPSSQIQQQQKGQWQEIRSPEEASSGKPLAFP